MTQQERDDKIMQILGSLDAKVDTLLENNRDHETRIRSLESSKAKGLGMLAVIGAVFTMAYEFVKTKYFSK